MKPEKLLHAMNDINDDLIQEASFMMAQKKNNKTKGILAAAACFVLVAGVAVGVQLQKPNSPNITIDTPAATSPMGMRKIVNFNGMRYTFLEEGATFKLEGMQLDKKLGAIEYNLASEPDKFNTDFSGSYMVGGDIYSLTGYHPDFRIAVVKENEIYLCESVDKLDSSTVNLQEYFKTAELVNKTANIEIYDHFKFNKLTEIDKQSIKGFLETISQSTKAELTNAEYEQIGAAQTSGKSFYVDCKLNDGTSFNFYVIPELELAMVGDNRYTLPANFNDMYAAIFENLEQTISRMG